MARLLIAAGANVHAKSKVSCCRFPAIATSPIDFACVRVFVCFSA